MNRMRRYILLVSIVWMSAVVTAQDLGLTKIPSWLTFPPDEHPGWRWETVAGVDFDSQGNLYISSRGGTAPPLTVWKPDGTLLRVFPGPEVLTWDHYVEIDRENNDIVWWAVEGDNVVYKMDQDGNVLLTLGTLGKDGSDATHFRGVTDVAWGPSGDLYVTDGARKKTCRVVKYDKDGNFIKAWGSMGTGDGQFYYPHSVYVTSDERVLVCDRNNGRIHVYDKDGNLLEYWSDFTKPYGIRRHKDGGFYVSEGSEDRICKIDIHTGNVLGYQEGGFNNAHSIAMDPVSGDLVCGYHQGHVERFRVRATTGGGVSLFQDQLHTCPAQE